MPSQTGESERYARSTLKKVLHGLMCRLWYELNNEQWYELTIFCSKTGQETDDHILTHLNVTNVSGTMSFHTTLGSGLRSGTNLQNMG